MQCDEKTRAKTAYTSTNPLSERGARAHGELVSRSVMALASPGPIPRTQLSFRGDTRFGESEVVRVQNNMGPSRNDVLGDEF